MLIFNHLTVDSDTPVGTYCGTGRTTYAFLGVSLESVVITAIVHFLGLQLQRISGTGHYTQFAAFAMLKVDVDRSDYFCHSVSC